MADINDHSTPPTLRSIGLLTQLGIKIRDMRQEPTFGPRPAGGLLLSALTKNSNPQIPLHHLRQRGTHILSQVSNYGHTHILTASELRRRYPQPHSHQVAKPAQRTINMKANHVGCVRADITNAPITPATQRWILPQHLRRNGSTSQPTRPSVYINSTPANDQRPYIPTTI